MNQQPMLIVTMIDIPGYEVEEVYGEVFGLTVRSRNLGSVIGAAFRSILGGELKGMTTMLQDSRQQAVSQAGRRGGCEGRQRDHRHALRHLRAGFGVDRGLRLRDGGQGAQALMSQSLASIYEVRFGTQTKSPRRPARGSSISVYGVVLQKFCSEPGTGSASAHHPRRVQRHHRSLDRPVASGTSSRFCEDTRVRSLEPGLPAPFWRPRGTSRPPSLSSLFAPFRLLPPLLFYLGLQAGAGPIGPISTGDYKRGKHAQHDGNQSDRAEQQHHLLSRHGIRPSCVDKAFAG